MVLWEGDKKYMWKVLPKDSTGFKRVCDGDKPAAQNLIRPIHSFSIIHPPPHTRLDVGCDLPSRIVLSNPAKHLARHHSIIPPSPLVAHRPSSSLEIHFPWSLPHKPISRIFSIPHPPWVNSPLRLAFPSSCSTRHRSVFRRTAKV